MAMELHPFLEPDIRPSPKWWYVLSTSGEAPSMRVGHSATFVPGIHSDEHDKVFIIGGANPSQVFSDVYILDLKTKVWDTQEAPGFRGRYEHAAFRVDNMSDKIFVFGGATQAGSLNDVQSLDISSGHWSDVDTTGTAPSPRTHRSSAVVGSKVYFYSGGHSGPDPVGDRRIHCLDTVTMSWSCLTPRGDPPKPRHGHLMLAQGSRIYLHGGMAGAATFYDDLHILDLDKNAWTQVKKKKSTPPPRAAHDGVLHNNTLSIFGGMSRAGALDDAHSLNTENNTWSPLVPEGPAPANRLDFAMCTVRLAVPLKGSEVEGDPNLSDLTVSCQNTREVLERELKPGSASSRESVSDSASVNEALFALGTETVAQTEAVESDLAQGDKEINTEMPEMETEMVTMVFINGGMDTEGEIFDDTLVLVL